MVYRKGAFRMTIQPIRSRDIPLARRFAAQGMHYDWYLDPGWKLEMYSLFFWNLECRRATRLYAAYEGDALAGVLLADMKGEPKPYDTFWRRALIWLVQKGMALVAKGAGNVYDEANTAMLEQFCREESPDGEVVFLVVDPNREGQGVGTALLNALAEDEPGKLVYLFTDNGCNYGFYEHRGFLQSGLREITMVFPDRTVPLQCFLYSKRLP